MENTGRLKNPVLKRAMQITGKLINLALKRVISTVLKCPYVLLNLALKCPAPFWLPLWYLQALLRMFIKLTASD